MPIEDSKRGNQGKKHGRLGTLREINDASGKRVEIDAVSPDVIGICVQAVVLAGAAIFFGSTADGGAVKISVYDGDDREQWFIHSSEELEWQLKALYEAYKT
jgi:hypothetical protein